MTIVGTKFKVGRSVGCVISVYNYTLLNLRHCMISQLVKYRNQRWKLNCCLLVFTYVYNLDC